MLHNLLSSLLVDLARELILLDLLDALSIAIELETLDADSTSALCQLHETSHILRLAWQQLVHHEGWLLRTVGGRFLVDGLKSRLAR